MNQDIILPDDTCICHDNSYFYDVLSSYGSRFMGTSFYCQYEGFMLDIDEQFYPFTDKDQSLFPVLIGTKYAHKGWNAITPEKVEALGILSQMPHPENHYEQKLKFILKSIQTLGKNIFAEHSLFLLKEHCKLFSPYNDKPKELLKVLELLENGSETLDYAIKEALKNYDTCSPFTIKMREKVYDLQRFLNAQENTYEKALQEVRNGKKETHWTWYIFPQMKGLGISARSQTYGIRGRDEAVAYISHPILRERLVEICQAVLDSKASVYDIFESDAMKVRSCVLLFASVSDIPVFKQLKQRYSWT